eukprot:CCRYP_017691-RA/>CCRYP_017691-RA protein AED:0.23 eAED:0.23 QI:0/-1/0/1/-1/1/1/0/176
MIVINENILKAANRLFLLLIALSIVLLSPWHQREDNNIPNSLLEWISMHLSFHGKHKTTTYPPSSQYDHTSQHGQNHSGGEENMNGKFMHALARGFYDVGIVLVVWYTGMCALGGACRLYLCLEECWNRRLYRVLPLYGVGGEGEGVEDGGVVRDGDDASLGEIDMGNLGGVRDED